MPISQPFLDYLKSFQGWKFSNINQPAVKGLKKSIMHKQTKIELSIEWHARTKQFSNFMVFFWDEGVVLEKINTPWTPLK